MSRITKFSRSFVATCVSFKIAEPQMLRNYDIITDKEKGLTLGQISIKHGISRRQVINIIKEYR